MDLPTLDATDTIITSLLDTYISLARKADTGSTYTSQVRFDDTIGATRLFIKFRQPADFVGIDWANLPGLINGAQSEYEMPPMDDDMNEWMDERMARNTAHGWFTSLPLNKKVAN
jgi:hypothetical protein